MATTVSSRGGAGSSATMRKVWIGIFLILGVLNGGLSLIWLSKSKTCVLDPQTAIRTCHMAPSAIKTGLHAFLLVAGIIGLVYMLVVKKPTS
jgi:hypothetical protein